MTNTIRDIDDPRLAPIMLRGELVATGYNDKAIRRNVKAGRWVKLRWGAYVDAPYFHAVDARGQHALVSRAVLRQANTRASLSHASALVWYDAPEYGLDLSLVHLTRHDSKAGRREAGVHQHCGQLVAGDVVERHGVSMMSPTRAGLELTTLADTESSLIQLNHLLHTGRTTLPQLEARYSLMNEWPSTLTTDLVLRLADPRIDGAGESRTFYLCYEHSLPMPVPQYEVLDDLGILLARLDFAWPKLGKFLEFDGKIKYEKLLRPGERASDVVIREKRREATVCRRTGWDCMRLDWSDLAYPRHTAERIRRFLFDLE